MDKDQIEEQFKLQGNRDTADHQSEIRPNALKGLSCYAVMQDIREAMSILSALH